MPRRIDAGPLIAAAGAVLLLTSLFLDWFLKFSAWSVFEVLDLVLAAIALATLLVVAGRFRPELDAREESLALLGGAALLIVASQLINHPPAVLHESPRVGAWLGLAGAALVTAGGVLSFTRVSVSLAVAPRGRALGADAVEPDAPPPAEAAAAEPVVQDELYPEEEREEPIGADDPEPWTATPEDDTAAIDVDPTTRRPGGGGT